MRPQTYIRAYSQTQTHSHPPTHTNTHTHIPTQKRTVTNTHTQTHTHTHTHTKTHAHEHTHTNTLTRLQTDSLVARDVRSSTTANAAADGLSTNKNYYNEQNILIEYTTTTHGSRQSIITRRFG